MTLESFTGDLKKSAVDFDIPKLPQYRKLLKRAPKRLEEALVIGTRRGLASFRRTWLSVPKAANIKGLRNVGPTPGPSKIQSIGQAVRWEAPDMRRRRGERLNLEIEGSIYTKSKAAFAMETGGTFKARRSAHMAIPIPVKGINATESGNVRKKWKSLGRLLSSRGPRFPWQFKIIPTASGKLVLVRKRLTKTQQKQAMRSGESAPRRWYAVFKLLREVRIKPGQLSLNSTWNRYGPEFARRYVEEIDKQMAKLKA